MDQFENGRTVLKQHQKFAIYCTGRMEATAAKLVAVLDAGVLRYSIPCRGGGWLALQQGLLMHGLL